MVVFGYFLQKMADYRNSYTKSGMYVVWSPFDAEYATLFQKYQYKIQKI